MKFLTFALFLTLGLCGVSPDADEVTEEGSNISNALGALSALKGMADEIQGLQAEIENMEPTDSVHFSEILPVLPDPPEGWSADDADGSTTQAMGGFSMSQGSRTYRRDKKRVTITVADWAYNKAIYMPFILLHANEPRDHEGVQQRHQGRRRPRPRRVQLQANAGRAHRVGREALPGNPKDPRLGAGRDRRVVEADRHRTPAKHRVVVVVGVALPGFKWAKEPDRVSHSGSRWR